MERHRYPFAVRKWALLPRGSPSLDTPSNEGHNAQRLALCYPLYEMGTEYAKGVKVQSNGKCYRSLVDNNTAELTDTASWREYDLLEDYLAALTETGIKKVLARFIGEKVKGMETRNLVDRRTLFDGAGRKEGRNPNTEGLSGLSSIP